MKISKLIILFLLSFFVLNCVETLITVSVFPDGAYHMKFHSEGDKKDIYDQDFPIPTNDPWLHEIQESEDDSIHIITSQSVLSGLTVFHPIDEGPGVQRHPIIVKKEEKLFSTSYNLLKIFKGRGVSKKYPLLSEAMNNISSDSIDLLVETEIIMHCLKMGMEDIRGEFAIKELTEKRILNHFRGVFYKAEEQGNLFGILNNPSEEIKNEFLLPKTLIKTNFKPFIDILPNNYISSCLIAMEPYINEANITLGLNDDTFKFACTLPGRISYSNADSISNDTLWWSFSSEEFLDEDFTIEAASIIYSSARIQRIIVAGALIILLGLILISKQRKNT